MIKYKVVIWKSSITEIEITRETALSVFYLNDKGKELIERKETNYHHFFDTRIEAVNYIEKVLTEKVKTAEYMLEKSQEVLNNFYTKYK